VARVLKSKWKEEEAKKAIGKELVQLFQELVALVPIRRPEIPHNATILKSHMFLVNKYHASRDFEKGQGKGHSRWLRSEYRNVP
jgi:hypothetical protein